MSSNPYCWHSECGLDPNSRDWYFNHFDCNKKEKMSDPNETGSYKVPLTKILAINPHSNADRLALATVYGFQVIVSKDKYKVGDPIIYVPIDSILPTWLEAQLFPEGSKIKLSQSRVRQIKIRSIASQGMIIDPQDVAAKVNPAYLKHEQNLAEILGITKYEPPTNANTQGVPGQRKKKPYENPRFSKYGGVDNIKWFPGFFEGKEVVIQEKLHGSNCRAGYLKTEANTLWKKFLRLIGRLPEYEYVYGSNNVQLQDRKSYGGYYGEDVYGKVLKKVDAFSKIPKGAIIFGELIGPGIQKNYDYGHTEHHFVLFDVKIVLDDGQQEYLNPGLVEAFASAKGFDFVPVLYRGPFNAELAKQLSMGPSVYNPKQKVREGIVIKTEQDYGSNGGKRALKLISEDYLADASNTDEH